MSFKPLNVWPAALLILPTRAGWLNLSFIADRFERCQYQGDAKRAVEPVQRVFCAVRVIYCGKACVFCKP